MGKLTLLEVKHQKFHGESRRIGLFQCICGDRNWVRVGMGANTRFKKCACPPKRYEGTHKLCTKCKENLPVADFYLDIKGNPRNCCKKCHGIVGKTYKVTDQVRADALARIRLKKGHVWRRFGITVEEHMEKIRSYGPLCNICGKPETRKGRDGLSLDHCHTTKKIRGALCTKCNSLLGFANDNTDILTNAIEYLRVRQ